MTELTPDDWAGRLARYLADNKGEIVAGPALQSLSQDFRSGDRAVDQRRRNIVRLLQDRRENAAAEVQQGIGTELQDWPSHYDQPLPPIQFTGLAGASLVAVLDGPHDHLLQVMSSWLANSFDELVLVDRAPDAPLASLVREMGIKDDRLRIIETGGASGTTLAQAFNLGFRVAQFARVVAVTPSTLLPKSFLQQTPLPAGDFNLISDGDAPSFFALDLHKRDLAATGGFNEYLDGAAWLVEDLAARLMSCDLKEGQLPADQVCRVAKPDRIQDPDGPLAEVLPHLPAFKALRNRLIGTLMPEWTGTDMRAYLFQEATENGFRLTAEAAPDQAVPSDMLQDATVYAMKDLLAAQLGKAAMLLSAEALNALLARPANSVSPVDLAAALAGHRDLIATRGAWLVIDLAVPLSAHVAQLLEGLAQRLSPLRLTLALRGTTPEAQPRAASLTLPLIDSHPDLGALMPTDLRLLSLLRPGDPLEDRIFRLDATAVSALEKLDQKGPAILNRRPKLFVDVQHGLGNRMRAIASAGAIAEWTSRELVVIWEPDAHCNCTYDDLFEPGPAVINTGFAEDAAAMGLDVYNYMEIEPGSRKDAVIALDCLKDAYLRSAYPFNSRFSTWHFENEFMRKIRPNAIVRHLVGSVRQHNELALHIRMEGGPSVEHLPYESAANWTANGHRQISQWRARSHFSYFLPRLDQLIEAGLANTVFLAADTPAVFGEFAGRYADRITWLPRRVADRSNEALVYALADAVLLSQSKRLLGSNWSSFTELAARLRGTPMTVELTGRDF